MRRSWRELVMGGGAVLLLVSLYLPWQQAPSPSGSGGSIDGLLKASFVRSLDGWDSSVGEIVALSTLALLGWLALTFAGRVEAGVVVARSLSLLSGYFGIATAVVIRVIARERSLTGSLHFHYAYGAYLGVIVSIVMVAVALSVRKLSDGRLVARLGAVTALLGLGIASLLPWERHPEYFTSLGIVRPAAMMAAVIAAFALELWINKPPAGVSAPTLGAAVVLLTGAALSAQFSPGLAYGAWIALGCALAAGVVSALQLDELPPVSWPGWLAVATALAATALIVSLFLPWQQECPGPGSGFQGCYSANGWVSFEGTAAGVLAFAILIALASGLVPVSVATAAVAVFIATLGFGLLDDPKLGASFGYGSYAGFASAALLVALALARYRPVPILWNRALRRLPAMLMCVAYLGVLVLPAWRVLPDAAQSKLAVFPFALVSWLSLAGVLLGVWLLSLWVRRALFASQPGEWLTFLPLGMLALAAVDLIRARQHITWGGGAVVVLCLLVGWLGWLDRQPGLDRFRVPEVLRIDRL